MVQESAFFRAIKEFQCRLHAGLLFQKHSSEDSQHIYLIKYMFQFKPGRMAPLKRATSEESIENGVQPRQEVCTFGSNLMRLFRTTMAWLKGRVDGVYLENMFLEELHILALESEGICKHVSVTFFLFLLFQRRLKTGRRKWRYRVPF